MSENMQSDMQEQNLKHQLILTNREDFASEERLSNHIRNHE